MGRTGTALGAALVVGVLLAGPAAAQAPGDADGGVPVVDAGSAGASPGETAGSVDAGAPPAVPAATTAAEAPARDGGARERATVVVMTLEANKPAADLAPGVTQSLAQRFDATGVDVITQADMARAMGLERQRQLLGCSESDCMAEIGAALGARYVVSGRVDKLGEHFVLNATVYDGQRAQVAARVRRDASDESDLFRAVDAVADELLRPFGLTPKPAPPPPGVNASGVSLSLKLGTQLLTSIVQLAPQVDLEVGYRITPRYMVFLQISAGIAFAQTTTMSVTPGLLGMRGFFRVEKDLQPYLGGGIGVLGTIDSIQGKARPSLLLLAGLQYLVTRAFGVTLESSMDILGAAFEFASSGKAGVNVGLSLGVVYRF